MVHKLALTIGALAALAVLATAAYAGNLIPGAAKVLAESVPAPAAVAAAQETHVQTETVYVAAPPPQKVIHITKTTPAKHTATPAPIVTVRVAPHHDGEGGDGGDGGKGGD